MKIKLVDSTTDPLKTLYMAYRVCYSANPPSELYYKVQDMTREKIEDFIRMRFKANHTSPLQQVWFEFYIEGVSRAFSHQFVRHHVGISFEQQSQRYTKYKKSSYVTPPSIANNTDEEVQESYDVVMDKIFEYYSALIELDVPEEDARFVLPNAATTNFKVVVNLAEFLHIADQRLCMAAQWEFRKVVALMRAEIVRKFPFFKPYIQPKCGENRSGHCDESMQTYAQCPLASVRPHRDLWRDDEDFEPLRNKDYDRIEEILQ